MEEQQHNKPEARKGVRSYVKIVKEGAEDDVAELPTNSDGLLPQLTVTALFEGEMILFYILKYS